MRKILLPIVMIFLGLGFVACNEKKESKTQLRRTERGYGPNQSYINGGGLSGNPQVQGDGWFILSQLPISDIMSENLDSTARAFISTFYTGSLGYIQGATVEMQLLNPGNTRLGLRFWDQAALDGTDYPVMVYMGPETGANIQYEIRNQQQVRVRFSDNAGSVTVSGYVSGNQFNGALYYNNGAFIGNFSLPVQGILF